MKTTLSLILAVAAGVSLAGIGLAGKASAETCTDLTHDGQDYSVCTASSGDDLRLWLTGPDGNPVGTFDRLREMLAATGDTLVFAMNAGMYHPDRAPVGLYVEERAEVAGLVTSAGPGNFGMLPNGVFCVGDDGFAVEETLGFAEHEADCRFATQSGPMLVVSGALHPKLLADSDSRFVRNGVGVSPDGQTAYFAISAAPVTFHQFALLFRDGLGTPNALYFDGNVSRLHSPELGRDDTGFPMGPIVGLVTPAH